MTKLRYYFLICIAGGVLLAGQYQAVAVRDSIRVSPVDSIFFLQHHPVINNSLNLFYDGRWIDEYNIDYISGKITFFKPARDTMFLIASYSYLDQGLPLIVGPAYNKLPVLQNILAVDEIFEQKPVMNPTPAQDELYTSGSIFRSLKLSPYGGTDFTGGLNLQLQGKLGNDFQVSGVLSDQSMPIQPEGNTQTLNEIDQVYLQVTHPHGQVTAGDIKFSIKQGKFLQLERQLIGLKGELNTPRLNVQAVYAGTKGNYKKLEMKGQEGQQGPYFLTSETGSRDIIVVAGSEKVFINGAAATRGENNDYTIDYSTGELFFTPRQLIENDTDIYIEYQYSDFQYNRNLIGGNWKILSGKRGSLSAGWISELDNISASQLNLSRSEQDSLQQAGDSDVFISGAVADSSGEYLLINGIFVHQSQTVDSVAAQHYKVFFQNDILNGSYSRKIGTDGRLFYEFVPENERLSNQDYYSPVKQLFRPKRQQLLQLSGAYSGSEYLSIKTDLSLSEMDQNRLSDLDDDDNLGLAYNIRITGEKVRLADDILLNYQLINWGQDNRYSTLQRDRSVQFAREWNTESVENITENMLVTGFSLERKLFKLAADMTRYSVGEQIKLRKQADLTGSSGWLKQIEAQVSEVSAKSEYLLQTNGLFAFLPGRINPFYDYQGEYNRGRSRFLQQIVGININLTSTTGKIGIGQRDDWWESDTIAAGLEMLSQGYFGTVDLEGRSKNGWKYDLVYRKRIKTEYQSKEKINFELFQGNINYLNNLKPLRLDSRTRMEETFTENRAIVYDSIGTGLGNYRYDPQFNEYIPDPNGAFIAYSVLTGDRKPTTNLENIQRWQVDFDKTGFKLLNGIIIRFESRIEFRGKNINASRVLSPTLTDMDITRSFRNLRSEIDYRPGSRGSRIYVWTRSARDLNGLDPRGIDLKTDYETGLDVAGTIKTGFQALLKIRQQNLRIESTLSELRNRTVRGYWLEIGSKGSLSREWQWEALLQNGQSAGQHHQEYSANAAGLKLYLSRFLGRKGRIQTRGEWYQVKSENSQVLPPEAVNGLATGRTLRWNINGQVQVGSNLSISLNGNYIADSRYQNLVTVTGEVRAYF